MANKQTLWYNKWQYKLTLIPADVKYDKRSFSTIFLRNNEVKMLWPKNKNIIFLIYVIYVFDIFEQMNRGMKRDLK